MIFSCQILEYSLNLPGMMAKKYKFTAEIKIIVKFYEEIDAPLESSPWSNRNIKNRAS